MTRTNHAKRKGDLTRTARCPFCNGEHRKGSKEQRECRKRYRAGKAPAEPKPVKNSPESRAGTPTTRYQTDALRGDSRAHGVERKARAGWSVRKLAKHFDLSVEEVRATLERAR